MYSANVGQFTNVHNCNLNLFLFRAAGQWKCRHLVSDTNIKVFLHFRSKQQRRVYYNIDL